MSLTRRVIEGVRWQAGSQIASTGLRFLVIVILSRMLSPAAFGVVATALLLRELSGCFTESSLNIVLVQRRELSQAHLNTAFWTCLGATVLIAGLLCLGAAPYEKTFEQEDLAWVIRALAVGYIISSLGCIQRSVLMRDMRFGILSFAEVGEVAINGIVSIYLAARGYGFKSLAIGTMAGEATNTLIVGLALRWRPRLEFSWAALESLWRFTAAAIGSRVLQFASGRADCFIVSKMCGVTPFGLYNLGLRLTRFPFDKVSKLIARVVFPAFSRVGTDVVRIRQGYLRLSRVLALLNFPIMAAMLVSAYQIVAVFFGQQWLEAVTPMQLLVPGGLAISMGAAAPHALWARGRAGAVIYLSALRFVTLVIFVLVGIELWEVNGAAAAVSVHTLIHRYITQHIVNRDIGLTMRTYAAAIMPATLATVGMICCMLAATELIGLIRVSQLVILAVETAVAAISYPLLVWIIDRSSITILTDIFKQTLRVKAVGVIPEQAPVSSRPLGPEQPQG